MTFIWPAMLWFLLSVPLLVLLYVRLQQRRRRLAAMYGSLGLAPAVDVQGAGKRPTAGLRRPVGVFRTFSIHRTVDLNRTVDLYRTVDLHRHIPPVLFMAGLAILILALARPQAVVSLPRIQGTVILAFDVSGSMAADDMQPTRMEAAKAAARAFVDSQPLSVQVGVVAFSDSGLSVQVPTNDKAAIFATINRLAPSRGTSLANGILISLNTIATADHPEDTHFYSNQTPGPTPTPTPVPSGTFTPAVIVLLTDGENTQSPDPLLAAQAATDRGVRIFTVGIGSPAGADLTIDGFIVHTQLDEAMLQQISSISGGAYYNAQSEQDLHKIYDQIDPQLKFKAEKTEVTSFFAGASILFLLTGGAFSLLWFGRLP